MNERPVWQHGWLEVALDRGWEVLIARSLRGEGLGCVRALDQELLSTNSLRCSRSTFAIPLHIDFATLNALNQTKKLWPPSLKLRAAKRGGVQTGGLPDLDASVPICPFLSFSGLSRFFRDVPISGSFPICPSPLSRPKTQPLHGTVPKGRRNPGPFRKKVGNPVWRPPQFTFFQQVLISGCLILTVLDLRCYLESVLRDMGGYLALGR